MFVLFDLVIERLFVWIFSCLSICCFNSKFIVIVFKVIKNFFFEVSLLVLVIIEFLEFKKFDI